MSNNKDSSAPLWDSEVTSVQHSIGPPIPEFNQRPEEGTKVPSVAGTEDARHVFPNEPLGSKSVKKSTIE
jgi:hypothetical protein